MSGPVGSVPLGECAGLVKDTVAPSAVPEARYIGLDHIGARALTVRGHGRAGETSSRKSRFGAGDILFGRLRPSFRKVARPDFAGVCSMEIWVIRPLPGVDAEYLFYVLASPQFAEAADRSAEGSRMPRASWDALSALSVSLPPLDEQRAVAKRLNLLSERIAVNTAMSSVAEETVQRVFRSWLVDFAPSHANAAGAAGSTPPHIAALFPATFTASSLGLLPEGWRARVLEDVAEVRREIVQHAEMDAGTPVIGLEHMPRQSIALTEWVSTDAVASEKLAFQEGDILFGALRPALHKVGVAPIAGVCSTDIAVMVAKAPEYAGFVLGHVSSPEFVRYADSVSSGTGMPRASWRNLAQYPVVLPDAGVLAAFNDRIAPCIDAITTATHATRALAAQRDALIRRFIHIGS